MSEDGKLSEEEIKDILDMAQGKVHEAQPPEGIEMIEWIYSNDKIENGPLHNLFHLFYDGVFKNRVGVMHCYNKATDMIDTVLVGIDKQADGVATWPLARILTEDEQGNYYAPDGKGGYLGLKEAEANDSTED